MSKGGSELFIFRGGGLPDRPAIGDFGKKNGFDEMTNDRMAWRMMIVGRDEASDQE